MRSKILSKEKLIEVAENIIKEEGLEACTLRNIASHACCALGTIYNYFESRDALLEAVFFQSWDNTSGKLAAIAEQSIATKDKALRMLKSVDEDIQNRRGLGEYLFGEILSNRTKESSFFKPMNTIIDMLINLLKESKKNRGLDDESLKVSAEWIYFGSIVLRKKSKNLESYYKVVVDKFF
jgi:AcrR family transcriptional regulator